METLKLKEFLYEIEINMIKCTVFYGTFWASKKCAIKLLYPISDDKVVRGKYNFLFSIFNKQPEIYEIYNQNI